MKKTNALAKWFIYLVLIYVFLCFVDNADTRVVRKGTVETVENGIVEIVDKQGNIWQWEEEEEKYSIGQNVKMIMNNNHTEDVIEDDIILKIKLDK